MRTMIFWRVGVVCTGVTCTCARRDRFVGLRPPRDDAFFRARGLSEPPIFAGYSEGYDFLGVAGCATSLSESGFARLRDHKIREGST